MKTRILGLAGVLLLVGALLVGMAGVAFANSVTWELSSSQGDGSITAPYNMNNSDNSKSESGTVALGAGGTQYWEADYPAASTTFFPSDSWTVNLRLAEAPGDPSTDISVQAGVYEPDTDTFTPIGPSENVCTWSAGPSRATYLIAGVDDGVDYGGGTYGFYVPAGDTIMFRASNSSGDTGYQIQTSDGLQSTFHYPGTENPTWPVPEIATIIMIVLGVLALGGYIWLRRRQAAPVVA